MSLVGAGLSAVINNVAALAILMTIDMDAAKKGQCALVSCGVADRRFSFAASSAADHPDRDPAQHRRGADPGTSRPANPSACSTSRRSASSAPLAGIVFVATIGWRSTSQREKQFRLGKRGHRKVRREAKGPRRVRQHRARRRETCSNWPTQTTSRSSELCGAESGLPASPPAKRSGRTTSWFWKAIPKSIGAFIGAAQLSAPGQDKHGGLTGKSMTLVEAVVRTISHMIGRTAHDLRLIQRRGVTLLGLSRQGKRFRERVRNLPINAGDVVLLLGPDALSPLQVEWFGLWPIEQGRHPVIQRQKALLAVGIFLAAVTASVMGLTSLPIALAVAVGLYAILNNRRSARDLQRQWTGRSSFCWRR